MSRLFVRKSVQDCEDDIKERGGLRRSLGKWHLTALGVGANAAVFAVVEAVLLRPLPYAKADDLVIVRHRDTRTGISKDFIAIGDFVDLTARRRNPLELLATRRLKPRGSLRLLWRMPKMFAA